MKLIVACTNTEGILRIRPVILLPLGIFSHSRAGHGELDLYLRYIQAGSWLSEGLTHWSSGLTDTVHTGLSAVQQLWANADATMKSATEERLIGEPKVSTCSSDGIIVPSKSSWTLSRITYSEFI